MYAVPRQYTNLIKSIDAAGGSARFGATQVNVEIGLTLAEDLDLSDEPIALVWALLSGTPLPNDRLLSLNGVQRRKLANARQIVPSKSRFGWEADLRDYAQIPMEHRNYHIDAKQLEHQIIDGCKRTDPPHPEYFTLYQEFLTERLAYKKAPANEAEQGETYTFLVRTESGHREGRVRFTEAQIDHKKTIPEKWFTGVRPRQPIRIPFAALHETAAFLDEREKAVGNRPRWVADLGKIDFHQVTGHGSSAALSQADDIEIDGFFHLAGIVSSGKTTLALLMIAYAIRHEIDRRITLVVGDTNSAIALANQINRWFRNDPAQDTPVAVPILGQTTRNVHLGRMLTSRDYRNSQAQGLPHWGERFLNPICSLDGLVTWHSDDIRQIPIGQEPCQRLRKTTNEGGKQRTTYHLCPLFAICPARQLYRDMPDALVWITTPGAMSQSGVPRHLEQRPIKIGDVIYEQSDLVIFDEAETIADWFDHVYAKSATLTNGKDGLLDRLDLQVARFMNANRTLPPEYQKWLLAERDATNAITSILTVLNAEAGQGFGRLRAWVKRGHFTRNRLSYQLSRRLAGLKEFDQPDERTKSERQTEETATQAIFRYFELLGNRANPFQPLPSTQQNDDINANVNGLAEIMQQIRNAGLDVSTEELIAACRKWIDRVFPDMQPKLDTLREKLTNSPHKSDRAYVEKGLIDQSVDELAMRLFFTLSVIVLDWHLDIVFHEWHRKPEAIDIEQPFSSIPHPLQNILPLPPTGAQFGLYSIDKQDVKSNPNLLTQFVYLNIGRAYVLNFHRLHTDLNDLRGPNVLAMSGTSYLPDSSRFNVQRPPNGLLYPNAEIQNALKASRFTFQPFWHSESKTPRPITVSGVSQKLTALRNIVQAMMQPDPATGGFLGRVLDELRKNGIDNPDMWEDRTRLLLFTNSYEQAEAVATYLQTWWSKMAPHIFYLTQGKHQEDYEAVVKTPNGLARIDIEQFAGTGGMVLVAPMQSIGRGFNILNKNGKAAFGAVIFMTRPMWKPKDMPAMAQEVNRYAIEWAEHADYDSLPESLQNADGVYRSALALRDTANQLWRKIELRTSYNTLNHKQADGQISDLDPELKIRPRADLAATTAGLIIQAIGRLVRGSVPFHAYFTDAAWAPITAQEGASAVEMEDTSLLQAMINVLNAYADPADAVGNALYGDLANTLSGTTGLNGN